MGLGPLNLCFVASLMAVLMCERSVELYPNSLADVSAVGLCSLLTKLAQCVCGWINPLLYRPHLSGGGLHSRLHVSLYAHIHCVLFSVFPCMFDFWLNCSPYCLDYDKLWADSTVFWCYIVARSGLSGHLWHCKYVKYVGCLVFLLPSSFPFFALSSH